MGRDKALIEIGGVPMARRVADALGAAGAAEVVAVGGSAPALRSLGLTVAPDDVSLVPTVARPRPERPPTGRTGPDGAVTVDPVSAALRPRSGAPVGGGRAPGRAAALNEPGRVTAGQGSPPGPLVGVVTALGVLSSEIVLVVACDLVEPSSHAMAATVAALAAAPDHDVAVPHDDEGVPQWLHAAWRRSARDRLADRLVAEERSVHRAVASAGLRMVTVRGLPAAVLTDADVPGQLPRQAD